MGCILIRFNDMNKESSEIIYILVCILFVVVVILGSRIDGYYQYHAKMHGAFTWGVVVEVNKYVGKSHHAIICYEIEDQEYSCYSLPISIVHLKDSVLVIYDTTRAKRSFVPSRNPIDPETAFFKSEQRFLGEKWHKNLEQYQHQLAEERAAHRRREHFYDYFCKDDK